MQRDVTSKRFALRIATMIDARLIWYKHYYRWADQIIADLDAPPFWVIELATIKYCPDAVAAVNRFVFSEPFESFDFAERDDEHIACLLLRYQARAISWATFLSEAGEYSDTNECRRDCEYFYELLNALEDKEYAYAEEVRQFGDLESELQAALAAMTPLYAMFKEYFREYVKRGM